MIRMLTFGKGDAHYNCDYIFDFRDIISSKKAIIKALKHFIKDNKINILFYCAWNFEDFNKYNDILEIYFDSEQREFLKVNMVAYLDVDLHNGDKNYNSFKYNALFKFSLNELKNYDIYRTVFKSVFETDHGCFINKKLTNKMIERLVINYDNFIEKEKS